MTDESSHVDGSLELVRRMISDVNSPPENWDATRSEPTQRLCINSRSSNHPLAILLFAVAGVVIDSGAGLLPW